MPRNYCPRAEKYFLETISIPMYSGLSDMDQKSVIKGLDEFFS